MPSTVRQAKQMRVTARGSVRTHEGEVDLPHGVELLRHPELNKGTAFTDPERERFGLRGLLPPRRLSERTQVSRAIEILSQKPSDLERYIYLIALQDRNETLFYRVVLDRLPELMPIVYTPTVGKACQLYGHIFRRPRGIWVSLKDRGRVAEVLANWPHQEGVRIIVVTDGERILGLGDLGADGMGIPVGKLTLYSALAGIPPSQCLPITLDVGTNNQALRKDPLYIGLPRSRVRGHAYDALVDEFMEAAHRRFPRALIQLEDFGNRNAFRLLERYRDRYCVFDDDIQGTGAMVLAGLLASRRITGVRLRDQRFLFLGAGEAAIGISDTIVAALIERGMTRAEARSHCWLFDTHGLVVKSRTDLPPFKKPYAHDHKYTDSFLQAIRVLKPTGIIGASGAPNTFTRPVVRAMAGLNRRPIVFALSNPTSKAECTARQACEWSGGRAVYASGSPFAPFDYRGRRQEPGQGNNAYVFPGVGLGIIMSEARQVTDEMFLAAAKALAGRVTKQDLRVGRVFPSLENIRDVSLSIAVAVAKVAFARGLARAPRPADLRAHIRAGMFVPNYRNYL